MQRSSSPRPSRSHPAYLNLSNSIYPETIPLRQLQSRSKANTGTSTSSSTMQESQAHNSKALKLFDKSITKSSTQTSAAPPWSLKLFFRFYKRRMHHHRVDELS